MRATRITAAAVIQELWNSNILASATTLIARMAGSYRS